jgi:hypothetical protein
MCADAASTTRALLFTAPREAAALKRKAQFITARIVWIVESTQFVPVCMTAR